MEKSEFQLQKEKHFKDFITYATKFLNVKRTAISFKEYEGDILGRHIRLAGLSMITVYCTGSFSMDADTIAHELVHQKQYETTKLSTGLGGVDIWEEKDVSPSEYFSTPYEVQARKIAAYILKKYKLQMIKERL
jgi:hypothetical protein